MNRLKMAWHFITRHKYIITVLVFLLIIGVIDENSLIRRVQHWKEIRELKSEINRYKEQYEESSETLKKLTSNPKELEKVAREKYMMKKENEDVYIFEEDLKKNQKNNP